MFRVLIMIAALGFAVPGGQRDEILQAGRNLVSGATIVETADGAVLLATATVPVQNDQRADKAFALAAAAALVEARAEAALFLGGTYATASEQSSNTTNNSDGASKREKWVRTHVTSMARVKLAGGEPIALGRAETGVRALVAWGLLDAATVQGTIDEHFIEALAEATLAAAEVPACDLRWVKDTAGHEGLRIVLAIHPDKPLGPCTRGQAGAPPCNCQLCRERVLEALLQRTVGSWSTDGDVGVARTFTRVANRTTTRAEEGAEAVRIASQRTLQSGTGTTLNVAIPPDFFTKSTHVYRHGDLRSVCAAFVPMDAIPQTKVQPPPASPGALRGGSKDPQDENASEIAREARSPEG